MTCLTCQRPLWPLRGVAPAGYLQHSGRGLCSACYGRHRYRGTLADIPRSTRANADVLADWAVLRSEGYALSQAAQRLGMSYDGLHIALKRARKADAGALG